MLTLDEAAAGWLAAILTGALGALFSAMSSARTLAVEVEQEAPSAVPATRNGQRRKARAVGQRYRGWALLASAVSLAAAVPSVVVLRDIDPDSQISWQRCGLVAVTVVWAVATTRMWMRASRLRTAAWLD